MLTSDAAMRWMIKRDEDSVLDIEAQRFSNPWDIDTLADWMRSRNSIAQVCELSDGRVAGYVFYELHRHHINVVNLAVHPELERIGLGTMMIDRLISKLSEDRRQRIFCLVREGNLAAQLFLKGKGFRVERIERRPYNDCDEDAYEFVFRYAQ